MFSQLRERLFYSNPEKVKVPRQVMAEVDHAVEVLKNYPEVEEVRLFGSAIKGRWKATKSDIDLAVFISGTDPEWSAFNRVLIRWNDYYGDGAFPEYGQTKTRQSLMDAVERVSPRVEVHLANETDMQKMAELGGCPHVQDTDYIFKNSHLTMKRGRLIFRRQN